VSRRTISGILEGGEISHDLLPWLCDVRDVARAHVLGGVVQNPPPPLHQDGAPELRQLSTGFLSFCKSMHVLSFRALLQTKRLGLAMLRNG